MPKRIFLVHAYRHSMAPIDAAFRTGWPQAQTVNLLDESFYADVPPDGAISPALSARVASILRHCVLADADGIVFTGSTFGPAVEVARRDIKVPVLKADEALGDEAVKRGERILLVCTQQRAMKIVRPNLDEAIARMGGRHQVTELWTEGAKAEMDAGRADIHDSIIADYLRKAGDFDVIVLGQISMAGARTHLPDALASRLVTSSEAAVARMRMLVEN
jgi:Asp/Glu/hydantoin racemase